MASLYLSAMSETGKKLALTPLTNRAAQYVDPPIADLSGYFLVEGDGQKTSVLARVENEEAALRLGALLGLS
jgi:hypothetical protein